MPAAMVQAGQRCDDREGNGNAGVEDEIHGVREHGVETELGDERQRQRERREHGSHDGNGHGVTRILVDDPRFEHVNAFKISPLRGIRHTAPYFHDNSAKTLEPVVAHYATFFRIASGGLIQLTPGDERDIVAFMKLLD